MTLDTGARAAIFVAHGMACVSVTANNQIRPTPPAAGWSRPVIRGRRGRSTAPSAKAARPSGARDGDRRGRRVRAPRTPSARAVRRRAPARRGGGAPRAPARVRGVPGAAGRTPLGTPDVSGSPSAHRCDRADARRGQDAVRRPSAWMRTPRLRTERGWRRVPEWRSCGTSFHPKGPRSELGPSLRSISHLLAARASRHRQR